MPFERKQMDKKSTKKTGAAPKAGAKAAGRGGAKRAGGAKKR